MSAANSYYEASSHPAPTRPELTGTLDCDVCVVGAGIAGCSAALHLAERGYRVMLLEAERVGWGASGRNGGQALPGVAAERARLRALIGPAAARAIWDISVEGLRLVRELIARHHIECDWVDGHMLTALKPRHERELLTEIEELRSQYGYESVRYMARDEVRSLIQSERYSAASYDSNAGHLHPLNYTLGLAAAAERAGVRIFESTRALALSPATPASPALIRTSLGSVRSRFTVLCGNVYLGNLVPALRSKIIGVSTYIVATEPLQEERARRLIANDAAVSDLNWVLDYFRLSADHRLLFGGRVNYSDLASFDAPSATRKRMLRVFPQLADLQIQYSWGGYVDITVNRAPHFGRLAPEVYFLQGFSGQGLALAGIAGKLVAEAMAGTAERFDVFAAIPHGNFPGGALLRRPALVLAMLYYRLRDLL
ncbi:MAG TPA: FAD-binding oxidoreductase [Steroidobacteraceae bacterium]|nr:FAD-binding oxidoreductase [Steroidobacteraceae bacterium]